MNHTCIFCTPEKIKHQFIHEMQYFYIVLSNEPVVEGHVLIIPFRHVRSETELSKDEHAEYFVATKWVEKWIKENYKKDSFIFINAPSGQSVLHLHKHMMPNPFVAHGVDTALRNYLRTVKNFLTKAKP